MVTEINEKEFSEKLEGKCLVDFYASWCPPCKMLSPVIDEVSEEIENVNFYKVNIDENIELANKYGIMTVPTLIIFKDGEIINRESGFMAKDKLKEFIGE